MEKVNEALMIAIEYSKIAYQPYSNFSVGACVCCDGELFGGCNVENASYGGTICAERTAIVKAVSEGKKKIDFIVIYTPTKTYSAPCGFCRQFINEFATEDTQIYSFNKNMEFGLWTMEEILPNAFGPNNLSKENTI